MSMTMKMNVDEGMNPKKGEEGNTQMSVEGESAQTREEEMKQQKYPAETPEEIHQPDAQTIEGINTHPREEDDTQMIKETNTHLKDEIITQGMSQRRGISQIGMTAPMEDTPQKDTIVQKDQNQTVKQTRAQID